MLRGGGTKGSYEVGVLKAFIQELPAKDYAYDVIAGASIGAMNAAAISVFPIGEEAAALTNLESIWLNSPITDLIGFWPYLGPLEVFWRTAMFDNTHLKERMQSILDIGAY